MLKRCGTAEDNSGGENIPYTQISKGYHFYRFTVPQGTYNYVFVSNVQAVSYQWGSTLIVKKDGNLTLTEFGAIIQEAQTDRLSNINGENNLWRGRVGDTVGTQLGLTNSPDGVIKTIQSTQQMANGVYPRHTTFSRDVPFTAILYIDDAGASNAIRFCYQ
jgi:hypothetical protein